ncbi:MAG: UDP-N-acetylmuramate dehydrogenase [Candidatus Omnitrophota bacterium]
MKPRAYREFKRSLKGLVCFDRPLRDHTTFKIGGPSRVWIEPRSTEDLKCALKICSKAGIKPLIIGRGSNLLIFDGKIDKVVIRLSAPCFRKIRFSGRSAICGSGCDLSVFIKKCIEKGLSGPERFAGIPGTVGGAIMMNAGGQRRGVGALLEWVKVIDRRGSTSVLEGEALKLGYRDSGLSGRVILEAAFKVKNGDRKALRRKFGDRLKEKMQGQDYTAPSAGCIFKNPEGSRYTSGQMLQMSGLKGLRAGGAEISARHANFIINRGEATFSDVRSLIRKAKSAVKKNFGVSLQTEVKIIR